MILADTSIWVDHLRKGDKRLIELLEAGEVLSHPFVIGEIALGHLRSRTAILDALSNLPRAVRATETEVLAFIEKHAIFGWGIGYIDAHLLAAVVLTSGVTLWTRDKALFRAGVRLNIPTI